jgi:DNA-binding LacI/PurR family transcriptional regulator
MTNASETAETQTPRAPTVVGPRADSARVLRAVEDMCLALAPGDRIPTHTDLMRRFDASERTILRALDELQRSGRIVRRNGVGTFLADPGPFDESARAAQVENRTVVAVTVPDRSFFDRCMDILYRQAEDQGLTLVCRPVEPETAALLQLAAEMGMPRGVILFGHALAGLGRSLQERGCRVALVGSMPVDAAAGFPNVCGDQEQGGYLQVRHLLDLGHRRIAVTHTGTDLRQTVRFLGYERALREARRGGRELAVEFADGATWDGWMDDAANLAAYLRRPDAPTGLIAWNDHEAVKLLAQLQRGGIEVPRRISLIGYDDLPEGGMVFPQLTTIDSFTERLIQTALGLIARPAAVPAAHLSVIVPALVRKESTAPPTDS